MEIIGTIWINYKQLNYLMLHNEQIKNGDFYSTGNISGDGWIELYVSKDWLEKIMYFMNQIRESCWTREIKRLIQDYIDDFIKEGVW